MYVMCFLLVVLNIDTIFTQIIPAGVFSPYTWLTTGGYGVNPDGDVEEDNNVYYYSYGLAEHDVS